MSTTLPCGHPSKFGRDVESNARRCLICERDSASLLAYASHLCGVEIRDSDPLDFAEAIADEPTNELPKLIFADWMDEQGDPRGELVRTICELRKNEKYPSPEPISDRLMFLYMRKYELRRRLGIDPLKEVKQERGRAVHFHNGALHDQVLYVPSGQTVWSVHEQCQHDVPDYAPEHPATYLSSIPNDRYTIVWHDGRWQGFLQSVGGMESDKPAQ